MVFLLSFIVFLQQKLENKRAEHVLPWGEGCEGRVIAQIM
jgi:hypothetical protein